MNRSFSPEETRAILRDAVRLAALDATDIQTAERAEALRPVARLAGRILRVPVAQVNVLTADRQVPVASWVADEHDAARWSRPVGLDSSFCQYVVASEEPLLISDAREHALVRDNRGTTEAGIVAYASVPLRAPAALGAGQAGSVLGSVCVVDFSPRQWSAEDVEILEDLADAVTAELEVRIGTATRAAQGVADAASDALQRVGAALAESEARFRMMADSIPQLAWMAEADGSIGWYNRRFYEYTGRTLEEMRAGGWDSIHHPDHRERVTSHFREAIAARQPWEDTFPLLGRDGTYRWFLSRALPVSDPAHGGVRWFGTNTDVTGQIAADAERDRLLRAEQEARREAEEASRARTQFLAVMSHELRTPLNAIGGYAELLEMGLRGPVTDAQRRDFARIRRSQQHLLGLINEILNFTKLESGTVRFDVGDVSVLDILYDVTGMLHPQAAKKGLRFEVAACDPSLAVRADREKLRQVLVNLTTNAVKFTPAPGLVHLACSVQQDSVCFSVRDTGIGIPVEKQGEVFEPFVQVRQELTRTAEGTGLGLSISRDLARGMGGEITVKSEPGVGSTFSVVIPRAPDLAQHDEPAMCGRVPANVEAQVLALLRDGGAHAVLGYLNARTSHRFTGLYRFDGAMLRSVALFDREQPDRERGDDAPLHETYCSMVGAQGHTLVIPDSTSDPRVAHHPARETVVSYCGAVVRGRDGTALGTLCSFDVEARPVPSEEIPLMEAVAPLLADTILRDVRTRTGDDVPQSVTADQVR